MTELADNWQAKLRNCNCCPRECATDRAALKKGFCNTGTGFAVTSICAHMGEEPVLSGPHGICNIFFAHCNLQCIYCQNYQISDNRTPSEWFEMPLEDIIAEIEAILDSGAIGVGFVSPSHALAQMHRIIEALRQRGRKPVYVYNTNGYDKLDTIQSLEGTIDVYLPDLKYADSALAREYSGAGDYPEVAGRALKEMYRQKGADITLDDNELIIDGLVIRHLVLPNHVDNSKAVLRFIAEELSPDVHISLMAQYHPTPRVADHPRLGRPLRQREYDEVVREFERLGFYRGFVQDLSSPHHYLPDFMKDNPFE
ncbi:MAG: radical SAM protein [candidate division Zixibacteria bacterium]|nr:radical SAM protein [candidate division Zixibacteria bacterium]